MFVLLYHSTRCKKRRLQRTFLVGKKRDMERLGNETHDVEYQKSLVCLLHCYHLILSHVKAVSHVHAKHDRRLPAAVHRSLDWYSTSLSTLLIMKLYDQKCIEEASSIKQQ